MKIILLILLASNLIFAQDDIDISGWLKQVESGKANEVRKMLPDLRKKNPGSPSLIFLEGILEENGDNAVKLFTSVVEKFPTSQYADASAYRLYSYYKITSDEQLSEKYGVLLLKNYPASTYIKYLPADLGKKNTADVKYNYMLQAGAFSNPINAENLRKKFIKAGYFTVVKDRVVGGSIFKIVYTGRFRTHEEAEDFQVVLEREYGLKGIITKYQE